MKLYTLIPLAILAIGCTGGHHPQKNFKLQDPLEGATREHPKVDLKHWASILSLANEDRDGEIITSPTHLCQVELVRKKYERTKQLGRAVPVDIFLWSVSPVQKPYLTKLGGVPHRESSEKWKKDENGKPYTFVGQFCFADSKDIISSKIPDDIMLIFFRGANSVWEPDEIHVEWSSINLNSPMTADQCPPPSFAVPQLSGHIYRTNEYPESSDVFEKAGHGQSYLFPTTQSTKIGRETFFIQHDPRGSGEELFCALNSVHPKSYPPGAKWPFIDLEVLPKDWKKPDTHYEWGKYRMMFGDVGCLYFLINQDGKVTWSMDCY